MIIKRFLCICVYLGYGVFSALAQFEGGIGDGDDKSLYDGNLAGNVAYNGGNGDGHALGVLSAPISVPVKWIYFRARAFHRQSVLLNWATATEINNSYFDIERSINGFDFEVIANVQGNGTSQNMNRYYYADENIPLGVKYIYYRLRQVDFDGKFKRTNIEVVKFEEYSAITQKRLAVFPNPFGEELVLRIHDAYGESFMLELHDMSGRLVYSSDLGIVKGVRSIYLPNLSAGIYLLNVHNGNIHESIRIMKYE